ncbi:unnamed protein product [Echinostoma caproni]|uniref:RING-type domain-containing protein n=1 Tax=Echinostoma caproni TaxID=27848 RepID=A0A183APW8_9TREM|nr:unnamed protein product [Echinostoma caproni]
MDMKQNVTEVGMQVASTPTCCIVDAVSSTGHVELCPEAQELLGELKCENQDSVTVNLETISVIENITLDRTVKDNFSCPICQGFLVRARVLGCGHQFCRECLYRWLKLRRMCPMCRQPVVACVTALFVDTFLDDVVDHCGNDELKRQRQLRKQEKASASLDEGPVTRIPTEMTTMMISNYAQTISAYSHGLSHASSGMTTDNWTQANTMDQGAGN